MIWEDKGVGQTQWAKAIFPRLLKSDMKSGLISLFFYLLLVFMTAVPLMLRGNTNERFLERHRDTVAFGADALGKLVSSCQVRCD